MFLPLVIYFFPSHNMMIPDQCSVNPKISRYFLSEISSQWPSYLQSCRQQDTAGPGKFPLPPTPSHLNIAIQDIGVAAAAAAARSVYNSILPANKTENVMYPQVPHYCQRKRIFARIEGMCMGRFSITLH